MRILSVDVGIRHLAWFRGVMSGAANGGASPLSHVSRVDETAEWHVEDIVPADGPTNVNEIRVEDVVPWMLAAFHKHKASMLGLHESPVERVFLEQQPLGTGQAAARNIKTKVLSHILQVLIVQELPGARIAFVSPRKKIRHAALVLGHAPETYNDNKKAAKLLAPRLLRALGAPQLAEWFERARGKKDDLADALLQGVYALDDELEEERLQAGRVQRAAKALEPKRPAKRKKAHEDSTAAVSAAVLGALPSASSAKASSASGATVSVGASAAGASAGASAGATVSVGASAAASSASADASGASSAASGATVGASEDATVGASWDAKGSARTTSGASV